MIGRVSGRGYAEFMQQEIFAPLGMSRTTVHAGPGITKDQAVKYSANGRIVPPCDTDSPGASAIYGSAHDLIRFGLFHLQTCLPDQSAVLTKSSIEEMQRPSPETGPMRPWEGEGSGYGLGWFIGVTKDGLRVVQHSGGTLGVGTVLVLVPEEELAVAVLSNGDGPWADLIAIQIVCTLLSLPVEDFLATATGSGGSEGRFAPEDDLVGSWAGHVHTYRAEVPLTLNIQRSGTVSVILDGEPSAALQAVSYRDQLPQFLNDGEGKYLRGWMAGQLPSEDVARGRPTKLWLELKLREGRLNGSLVAFSQRELYTGPLSHWVELRRR